MYVKLELYLEQFPQLINVWCHYHYILSQHLPPTLSLSLSISLAVRHIFSYLLPEYYSALLHDLSSFFLHGKSLTLIIHNIIVVSLSLSLALSQSLGNIVLLDDSHVVVIKYVCLYVCLFVYLYSEFCFIHAKH